MNSAEDTQEDVVFKIPPTIRSTFDMVEITGGNGFWQQRIFAIVFFLHIAVAFHVLSMSFLAPNLDHWCDRPSEAKNMSIKEWRALAMPPEDQYCSRYKDVNFTHTLKNSANNSGRNTIPCDKWEYDMTVYSSTVLSEWDLVCDRKWLVSLSKSVFVAGMCVSLIVFGQLSDWIGRKPVIIISGSIAITSAVVSAFATTFTMFLIIRFFIAFGATVMLNTPFVLLMEIVSPKYRYIYGLGLGFGFSVGFVCLPLIAWIIRDSFWIQLFLAAPFLILLAIPWIPESPRWLLNHGKIEHAQEVLIKAAKINGVELSSDDKTALKSIMTKGIEIYECGGNKGNILDLLKTPGLWQITLNLYFNWFVNSFVYYGLSYNTNELAGNPFVNFTLSGVAEIPGYLLALFIIRSLGMKNVLAASMVISGVACFCSYLLPSDPWWMVVTVSMIGKSFITISFAIIYIYSNELFPTVVRNIGMGSASLCGRCGSIIAPFMRELGFVTHPIFPQIIFGILAISSGLLVLLLPDTSNRSVPDTVEEAAQFSRKNFKMLNRNLIKVKLPEEETDSEPEVKDILQLKNYEDS